MKDTTGKRERQIIIITILILTTVIKLVGINKIYRTNEIETVALEDVNLTVNKGEFLSIMGPSGCGKSTLLNIMGLLDTPTGGSIEVAGTRIESMKDKEINNFIRETGKMGDIWTKEQVKDVYQNVSFLPPDKFAQCAG